MKTMTSVPYLALLHQVPYTKVCKVIGITPQQFSDWVKKRRPVPKDRLQQLAEYFGVSAELLVDNHYYLLEVSGVVKLQLKIAYITGKLKMINDEEETAMLHETLAKLQEEIELQELQDRFAVAIQSKDPKVQRLCLIFLEQLEQQNFSRLDSLLST